MKFRTLRNLKPSLGLEKYHAVFIRMSAALG